MDGHFAQPGQRHGARHGIGRHGQDRVKRLPGLGPIANVMTIDFAQIAPRQIGVDNHAGTPTGKPKRMTQWAGSNVWGLSASADGKRLVLNKVTLQDQVYLGELTAGGTRMKAPQRLTNDDAFDLPTAWTPDGQAVLFDSNRNGTWSIFKRGINQETAEPGVYAFVYKLIVVHC